MSKKFKDPSGQIARWIQELTEASKHPERYHISVTVVEKLKCPECGSYNFRTGGVLYYEAKCLDCGYQEDEY